MRPLMLMTYGSQPVTRTNGRQAHQSYMMLFQLMGFHRHLEMTIRRTTAGPHYRRSARRSHVASLVSYRCARAGTRPARFSIPNLVRQEYSTRIERRRRCAAPKNYRTAVLSADRPSAPSLRGGVSRPRGQARQPRPAVVCHQLQSTVSLRVAGLGLADQGRRRSPGSET